LGADFGPDLEYWDGSEWVSYTEGDLVALDEDGQLLVRTAILDDEDFEGAETFKLVATNTGGTDYEGTATILDDGTGDYWIDDNAIPATPEELADANIDLDDDRLRTSDGYIWIDVNGNAIPDENLELHGLDGVRIELYRVVNGVTSLWATVISGPDPKDPRKKGYYVFEDLPFGEYFASVDLTTVPSTLSVNTTALEIPILMGDEEEVIIVNFGFTNVSGTAIELLYFVARSTEDGVQLAWATALEMNTLGYRLHRGPAEGNHVLIGDELVPAIGADNGAEYAYMDRWAQRGSIHRYWLEEVEADGTSNWYGPVLVAFDVRMDDETLALTSVASSGLKRIWAHRLIDEGIPGFALSVDRLAVELDGISIARFMSADELASADDFVLFYVAASNESVSVSLRDDEELALEMAWDYARPHAGAGEVVMAAVSGAGIAYVDVAPEVVRVLISGFTSPRVWVLDVTDTDRPILLYGYAVVKQEALNEYAVYLSVNRQQVTRLIAVQDEQVEDLEDFGSARDSIPMYEEK
jgi:hypothetical protein